MSDPKRQARVFTRNWWIQRRRKLLGEFNKDSYQQDHLEYMVTGKIKNLHLAAKMVFRSGISKDTHEYTRFLKEVLAVSREDLQRFKRYIEDTHGLRLDRKGHNKGYKPMKPHQSMLALRRIEIEQNKDITVVGCPIKIFVTNKPHIPNGQSSFYIGNHQTVYYRNPTTGVNSIVIVLWKTYLNTVHTIKFQKYKDYVYLVLNANKIPLSLSSRIRIDDNQYLDLCVENARVMDDLKNRPDGP